MDLLFYGVIGDPETQLDAASVVPLIQAATGDITVRVNSLGGLVFDGLAIYTALKDSPRKVTVMIDGIAGSMASVIAMAGDEILMAENGLMMIHNPMDGTFGDSGELRSTADRLDKVKEQLVNIYVSRTGLPADQIAGMLDSETWMNAQEAVQLKFVTGIFGAMRTAAQCDATKFGFRKVPDHPLIAKATSVPAPAAVITLTEDNMPDVVPAPTPTPTPAPSPAPAPTPTPTPAPTPAPAPAPTQPVNVTDAVAVALAAERARATSIRNEATRAGLEANFGDTLVNEGVSIEVARERIIDQLATNAPTILNYRPATIPLAQFQARADAMGLAIANRANPVNQLTDDARAFAGRRLIVLARDWLDASGMSTRNMSDVEVAKAVFRMRAPVGAGQHTTADFPSIMGTTVGRTLRRAYELAPKTFLSFTRQTTVPDFRPVSRIALSDISPMQQVAEGAEYQYATVGDSAETYAVGKWGEIISLTWETIINDDLNAFDRLPMAMGQEAAQVEGDVVYAILLSNPLMADGITLFHASHGNLAGAGAAIAVASLSAGRVAMRTQKAPKGRFTTATPSTLIVGPLKEQEANQYTSPNYVATTNAGINPEYNRSLSVTVEPRITDNSWFLSADPKTQAIDTIETAYLAGHEGVQIDQQQGFDIDGVKIKAKLVFGAKAIDYRGMYKNPGA